MSGIIDFFWKKDIIFCDIFWTLLNFFFQLRVNQDTIQKMAWNHVLNVNLDTIKNMQWKQFALSVPMEEVVVLVERKLLPVKMIVQVSENISGYSCGRSKRLVNCLYSLRNSALFY